MPRIIPCLLFVLLFSGPVSAAGILVLGDSLSAAYGIPPESGWVALLEQRLEAEGYTAPVHNRSISGETTAGGLRRLPAALATDEPDIVLIELGANDGLRGLPLSAMRKNLQRMIALSREAGARILLFEMRIPPNYGPRYTEAFHRSFAALAEEQDVALQPFFLADIALDPGNFQDDGIHPTAAAQPALLEAIWPQLKALLREI